MKITNLEFTDSEAAILYVLVGQALKDLEDLGKFRKEVKEIWANITPPNLVRLALGFETRKRGGARPNTGRRKQTDQTASNTQ